MSVHRLVALTFIPNPQNKKQVNHINGNKEDNTVPNLEWATAQENVIHALNTKLRVPPKGKDHHMYGRKGISNPLYGRFVGDKCHFYGMTGQLNHMYGKTGKLHCQSQAVICTTESGIWIEYDSINQAEKETGVMNQNIGKACNGHVQSSGRHPITNEKMYWTKRRTLEKAFKTMAQHFM